MRKTAYILAAAAAALTSSIGIAQDGKQSFVHEGNTYVYTTTTEGNRQVIDGHRYPSGQPFHLVVRGSRVSGMTSGVPVAFRTIDAQGASGGVAAVSR